MKTLKITAISLSILISSCSQNYKTPETELERFSYSIGVNIATTMKEKHSLKEIDGNSVAKGFNDVIYNKKLDIELLGTDSILNDYFFKLSEDLKKISKMQAAKIKPEQPYKNNLW